MASAHKAAAETIAASLPLASIVTARNISTEAPHHLFDSVLTLN
jgi:hypothetical protein